MALSLKQAVMEPYKAAKVAIGESSFPKPLKAVLAIPITLLLIPIYVFLVKLNDYIRWFLNASRP